MIKIKAKVNSNPILNFNGSAEIAYWAKKYNTSQSEIQRIFAQTGNSISKTLLYLQQRIKVA
jgi:hypothetical protein